MKLERIKAIYDEISRYEIKLEPDPRSLGPLYLQNIIAECRNHLNNVSRIALEVHREKQEIARALRVNETDFEVAFAELLAKDERVKGLPSIEDRKATIHMMLRERLNTVSDLKGTLQDLDYVEKAIRHRHKELTSTMTEIKLQRSLIRDEIDSGAMYGDERKGDHERGPGPGPLGDNDIDENELDDLLNKETEAASPEETPEPPPVPEALAATVEPEPDPKVEEAKIKAFLDAGESMARAAEGEDYSEVFARL